MDTALYYRTPSGVGKIDNPLCPVSSKGALQIARRRTRDRRSLVIGFVTYFGERESA
jgi:hypothetical protein